MLRRLSVSNYILIDSLEIEFDPRLNIITGETGAGKSILLGALGLLLGNKNEGAALRDTQRNCASCTGTSLMKARLLPVGVMMRVRVVSGA